VRAPRGNCGLCYDVHQEGCAWSSVVVQERQQAVVRNGPQSGQHKWRAANIVGQKIETLTWNTTLSWSEGWGSHSHVYALQAFSRRNSLDGLRAALAPCLVPYFCGRVLRSLDVVAGVCSLGTGVVEPNSAARCLFERSGRVSVRR